MLDIAKKKQLHFSWISILEYIDNFNKSIGTSKLWIFVGISTDCLLIPNKNNPTNNYPLVNDHIAGWNIPIFNRKYIHLHFGASIFQPAMLDNRSVINVFQLFSWHLSQPSSQHPSPDPPLATPRWSRRRGKYLVFLRPFFRDANFTNASQMCIYIVYIHKANIIVFSWCKMYVFACRC